MNISQLLTLQVLTICEICIYQKEFQCSHMYTVCSVLANQSDVLQLLSEVSKMTQYAFDRLVMCIG